jgi:hypothetical protein
MIQARELPDFLEAYSRFTANTESARVFHDWVGLSLISSALRKKVKLHLGRIRVYPNTYIVLVAEPGKARKSVAISYGNSIMKSVEEIKISADAITREALLQDLELSAVDSFMPDGTAFKHSSLSIVSTEFESFLGQKTENAKMLVILTDLFDCAEAPWKYRTKNAGNTTIPSVFLNILGATTPESLATALPSAAIGGGLTSRILFIWADKKEKKVPIPFETPETILLKEQLKRDYFAISQIAGDYVFTKDATCYWVEWYMKYEDLDTDRTCTDPSFNGWYSRKPMMILKLSMLYAASESSSLDLQVHHIEKAISKICATEQGMGNAFRSVGKSTITAEVDTVLTIIRSNKVISEPKLMRAVWRDLDSLKFSNVIATILSTGRVSKAIDAKGIAYYTYVSD